MKLALFVLLAACAAPSTTVVALCGDDIDAPAQPDAAPDASPDAPPDAAIVWNPTPQATFPDLTGQGHPSVTMLAPSNYASTADVARPLLLILHGWNQTGATASQRFRLETYHNEGSGALVLAPTGIVGSEGKRRWNVSPACCEPVQPANDEIAYLGGLVEQAIAAGWHIDMNAVFALGTSNGAAQAHALLCARADLFVGGIMTSGIGLPTGMTCAQSRPLHRLHLHTISDDTFRYVGNQVATFTTPDMAVNYPPFVSGEIGQAIAGNGCTGAFPTMPTTRTLNLDDHAGYPTMVADTVVGEVSGCPSNSSIVIWQGPYQAPTWNHSISTSPEFGVYIRDWLATHHRQ